MEEKLLKEMISLLNGINEKLTIKPGISLRGPIGDPGPEIIHHGQYFKRFPWPIGYPVDPSPEFYFSKDELIKIKVREMDMVITQVTEQLDLLKMQRDLMEKEIPKK